MLNGKDADFAQSNDALRSQRTSALQDMDGLRVLIIQPELTQRSNLEVIS